MIENSWSWTKSQIFGNELDEKLVENVERGHSDDEGRAVVISPGNNV